ncbi:MAG: insulinase family protein [Coriobacteriia bacterium]|nr:insulinase family protein [Coriobacteriia bacterium]
MYQLSTLDNGIRVFSERMNNVRSVSIGVWFRVGSRDELVGQYGLSHFLEHMFFKGTNKRDALAIAQDFESLGAEQNAFTSKEYTCYYSRVVDDKLEPVFEIIADMLTDSLFEQSDIDSEREVVIEEIARSEDTPQDYIFELFSDAAMPGHNLGRQIAGTRESVGSFVHDDCVNYLQSHYNAENCVVVACGNIEHELLLKLVERYLGSMPRKPRRTRDDADVVALPFSLMQKDTEQAHLVYGTRGIPLGDDDRFATSLLDSALGGGMSSRLFQEIREKRGLAYAVFSTTVSYIGAGNFMIYVGTRPDNLYEVMQIIVDELKKMLDAGLDEAELERMKDYLVGHTVLSQESTASRMIRIGRNAINDLPILSLDESIERYRAVSLDDIMRVAERVLVAAPTVAVISPLETDELQTGLSSILAQ